MISSLSFASTAVPERNPNSHARGLNSIQYLRAIAALSVMIYHTSLEIAPPGPSEPFYLYALAFGVDIFFVVSGFIMWTTTQDAGQSPLDFLRARIVRIVPLYWLALALYLPVLSLAGGDPGRLPPFGEIVEAYLFIPYIDSLTGLNSPYYTLGWTLNYEMFFYLVFAGALACRSNTARFAAVAAILMGLVLLRPVVGADGPILFRITSPLLLEFLAGMAIAATCRKGWLLPAPLALTAPLSALAFMAWLSSGHVDTWPRAVYFGLPAVLIVVGVVSLESRLARRPVRPCLLLGDASYSLYLSHGIVLKLAFAWLAGSALAHPLAAFVGVLSLELALGVACYRRIEQPLLWRLRRRRSSSSQPLTTPAPA
jgi:exopolysaccharide production protein ExoZ